MALIDNDSIASRHISKKQRFLIKPGATAGYPGRIPCAADRLSIARGITDQDNKDGPELLSSINPTFISAWPNGSVRIHIM
jgi:hypothetical protein